MTRCLPALAILLAPLAHGAPRTDPEQSRLRARLEAAEIADARADAATEAERTRRIASKLATKELETARHDLPAAPAAAPSPDPGKAKAEAAALAEKRADEAAAAKRAEQDLARAESAKARDTQPETPPATDDRAAAVRVKDEAAQVARARAPVEPQVDPAETTLASLELSAARRQQERQAGEVAKASPVRKPPADDPAAAARRAKEEEAELVKARAPAEPHVDPTETKVATAELEEARRQQARAAQEARQPALPAAGPERLSALRAREEADEIAQSRPVIQPTVIPAESEFAADEVKAARRLRDREVRAQAKGAAREQAREHDLAAAERHTRGTAAARVKQELNALVAERLEADKRLDAVRDSEARLASADLARAEQSKVAFVRQRERQRDRSQQYVTREAAWTARYRERATKRRDGFLDEQRERAELWAFAATEQYNEGIEDNREDIVDEVLRLADEMEKEAQKREKEQEEEKK